MTQPAVQAKQNAVGIESRAIYVAIAILILTFLVSLGVFWGKHTPLYDGLSMGLISALCSFVVAIVAFLASALPKFPAPQNTRWQKILRGLDLFALTFAHAAIAMLMVISAYSIFQQAFFGLTLEPFSAAAVVALTTAVTGYLVFLSGSTIAPESLALILSMFFISGAFTSMLTAEDKHWWQRHFSSLGIGDAFSAYTFNITLLISGIIIVTLSNYLLDSLETWHGNGKPLRDWRMLIIRSALITIGIFLAMVGVFSLEVSRALHNLAAFGMAVVFILLSAAFPLLLPKFSKAFHSFNYLMLAGILVTAMLYYLIPYLNLTAFELISTGLVFIWIIVFIRNSSATVTQFQNSAKTQAQEL